MTLKQVEENPIAAEILEKFLPGVRARIGENPRAGGKGKNEKERRTLAERSLSRPDLVNCPMCLRGLWQAVTIRKSIMYQQKSKRFLTRARIWKSQIR